MKITCSKKNCKRPVSAAKGRKRRVVASSPYEPKRNTAKPYMYFTKHGIGPGTLPKDVNLVKWNDIDDYMTQIWVDRPLSTKELDNYDIIPETCNTELMKKYEITSATKCKTKRKFTVKASRSGKDIKDPFKDIVMYINHKKIYEGKIETGDSSLEDAIERACENPDVMQGLQNWCNSFGDPFDFDGTAKDTAWTVAAMIRYDERDADDNFYIDGDGYIDMEVFYAEDEVQASTSTKKKFTVKASTDADEAYERMERMDFAEQLVSELEAEYGCKLSDAGWGQIHDLANDLEFGKGAEKHGSTPMLYLENVIYDIFEEYTGCIVGSESVSKGSVCAASDNSVSSEDVDELVLYITNDGDLYRQMTTPIINNMKRKHKNGNYDDTLAVKAWMHLTDAGVKKYDKEFGSGKGSVAWLNKATREAIAEELKEYYEDEISFDESAVQGADDSKTYTITYDRYQDTVTVDNFESEQDAVDKLIDKLESEGSTGCFVDPDEYNEDEYVIGGNHGLALYHGGNFHIEETGSIESATTVDVPSEKDSSVIDESDDSNYIQKLADGVVAELNDYWDGMMQFYSEISDEAITFKIDDDKFADWLWIQPLDGIIANDADLESDITELYESVMTDILPSF